MKREYKLLLMISLFLIQIDQLSKIYINNIYPFTNIKFIPDKGNEIIPGFFYIFKLKNTGAAWGNFSGNTILLSVIGVIVFLLLLKYVLKEKLNNLRVIYYGMLFAGILGNLLDRLLFGYVTDFLNFYIFSYDYPVFNIADILIVIGVLLCLIDIIRGESYDM